ncbi:MAG TPA: hypothetical protein PLS53_00205 [Thermoanaerobaculaceae bacterium]|nr:hypothetical protein [Thermoanaerobaculaceae bacterium]
MTATRESPGATTGYHLDVPLEKRPAFAKSAAQDGGLVILDAPSPQSGAAREALLAASQDNTQQGTMVMRPRTVEQMRGDGKARRGVGVLVNPNDVGLAMQPILIQRQADVDDMGQALDPEAAKPQLFISDGTVAGARRIDESGSVIAGETQQKTASPMQAAAAIPYTPAAVQAGPVSPGAPAVAQTPKQRLVYEPPSGGKIRASADDVIVSDKMILVISDANADTSYEPAPTGASAPIKLGIGTEVYEVMYGGWSAEKSGKMYLVFIRIPKGEA